eukprot:1194834-Prorocentrum_minimum.AAC.2
MTRSVLYTHRPPRQMREQQIPLDSVRHPRQQQLARVLVTVAPAGAASVVGGHRAGAGGGFAEPGALSASVGEAGGEAVGAGVGRVTETWRRNGGGGRNVRPVRRRVGRLGVGGREGGQRGGKVRI